MNNIFHERASKILDDIREKLFGKDGCKHLECLEAVGRGENPFPVSVFDKATLEAKDNLIYITLPPSEGITGPSWIDYFYEKDFKLSAEAQVALKSKAFEPTLPGFVHRIVVLRANFWKKDPERINKDIWAEGVSRKWLETHPEAVCLIRKCFSDRQLKDMGLEWIVGIHKPIVVLGKPHFLFARRIGETRCLDARNARPDCEWNEYGAFAWSLPQEISSQA